MIGVFVLESFFSYDLFQDIRLKISRFYFPNDRMPRPNHTIPSIALETGYRSEKILELFQNAFLIHIPIHQPIPLEKGANLPNVAREIDGLLLVKRLRDPDKIRDDRQTSLEDRSIFEKDLSQ